MRRGYGVSLTSESAPERVLEDVPGTMVCAHLAWLTSEIAPER